jgi:ectoine hydroxylase-related dioxygenase (phytanoyl-CoA dioxygenase family)
MLDDNFYFGTTRSHTVSAVLYLRDMSPTVGCLRVVPGSHKDKAVGADHQRAKHYHKGVQRDGEFIPEETIVSGALSVDNAGKRRRPIDVCIPAGSAVLFDANLLHSVHPNRSDGPSERVAFHYIPGDLGDTGFRGTSFARGDFADRHLAAKEDGGAPPTKRERNA